MRCTNTIFSLQRSSGTRYACETCSLCVIGVGGDKSDQGAAAFAPGVEEAHDDACVNGQPYPLRVPDAHAGTSRQRTLRGVSVHCIDSCPKAAMVVLVSKTHQLQIRISAEDKALIRARAANAGMDVSKWVLQQVLPPVEREFQALCRALAARPDARSFTFAEYQDWFNRLTGSEFVRAVRHAPEARLPAFEANYLAATVEHAAAIKGVDPPRWTATVEVLDAPWFASSLKSLRLHLLTHSPPPFRRRNLFIDSSVGQRV